MRKYRIQQKSTGLFFSNFNYTRKLTKSGRPSKGGKYIAVFTAITEPRSVGVINDYCRSAIYNRVENFFHDTEIMAYEYAKVRSTIKIKTMESRWGQKVVIEKLKNGY